MARFLENVQPDERYETFWAAGTGFLVLVAHAILETARDTLFLTHLPASRLPWVYLTLAAVALATDRLLGGSRSSRGDLRNLILIQIAAAAGTTSFLILARSRSVWVFYALYVWGGLASTVILIRFWLFLTGRFGTAQAKRLFPIIASGPVLGSLTGFALAGILSPALDPRALLGVSAAFFLLSAAGSTVLWRSPRVAAPSSGTADGRAPGRCERTSLRDSVAIAIRHPYVRRIGSLLLLASVTVTLADFVFKSVVSREIAAAHLSTFLAASYFAFETVSLILLLTAVVPFVRLVGVTEALAVPPALLLLGGVILTALGGLGAVLCLRGVDGALRWSLQKTASELLYVPMAPRLRSAVKTMSDIVAHRGGQALASVLILAWLGMAESERMMGPVVVACAGGWLWAAVSTRKPYLELFRETLGHGSMARRLEFPDLDMASLETLVAALNSADDHLVIAAMDLLQQSSAPTSCRR